VSIKKAVISCLLGLFLYFQTGCSIYPLRYAMVNAGNLEDKADIALIDPNNMPYPVKVVQGEDGSRNLWWEAAGRVETVPKLRHRVKYHSLYSTSRFMVVEGRLGTGSKKYPVVLDTGASQPIFVKDTHILENKLPICHIETAKYGPDGQPGLCKLTKLCIGDVVLANWPTLYLDGHMQLEFFGFPVAKDNSIIVGLPALREFKYIVFDSIRREVEFSNDKEFKPEQCGLWERYSLSIEEDFHGNSFLFVKIPIAEDVMELQLDTGSGKGLAVREELWERIREKISEKVRLRNGRDLYPYIGDLPCRQGVVREIRVGSRTVRDADVSVFPNDSPLMNQCDGLLGMQWFGDTVIVLDFEGMQMWVKNPAGGIAGSAGL